MSRSKNTHADLLAALATSIGESLPKVIMVEDLATPSHNSRTLILVNAVHLGLSWMDPVVSLFRNGILLEDNIEAKKI